MWTAVAIAFVVVLLLIAFLAWRYTSVARGGRKRDRRIIAQLDALAQRLDNGKDVTQGEIIDLGSRHELRYALYILLKEKERLYLVPDGWRTIESQAKAALAYWMMHPNELCDPAEQIEVVDIQKRTIADCTSKFVCLKYRMSVGHWAGRSWHLAVAGPYFEHSMPYSGEAGAFARGGDIVGKVQPDELIDWYIKIATGRAPEKTSE